MATRRAIPLARPSTGEQELEEIRAVLASGQLSQGPRVVAFERMVADFVGVRHAFATSSCTTALHLTLVALGIGPGDEVLVPDFTFPATANVVVQQGATPVLADIDLRTYNVDPRALSALITPRTRAVIPVHLFGLAADMDPITELARTHGLAVVEDAACALGATYHDRRCGALGDVACLSFHARKIITTGEGGMILTDRDDVAEKVELLRSHGGVRSGYRSRFDAAGFNYRMSDLQAAVGIAQMGRVEKLISQRRELAAALRRGVAGVAGVAAPVEAPKTFHVYQAFVVLVDEHVDATQVISRLRGAGVEATLGTYALHEQPFFQTTFGYSPGQLPASQAAFRRTIALPLYPEMEGDDVEVVVEALRDAVQHA